MAFTRAKRSSVDDTAAKGGKGDRRPSIRDLVQMIEWPNNAKFLTFRQFPGVVPVGMHDYPLYKKDGSPVLSEKYKNQDGSPKHTTVPKICLSFDPSTQEHDADVTCPYCDLSLYFKIEYWAEGIVREEEENGAPAKAKPNKTEADCGYKDIDNDNSWTPVRCNRYTGNTFKLVKELKQLNKVKVGKEKKPFPVDDEENGCDLSMNFDAKASGASMYGIQKGDHAPITDEENEYLRWDIEGAVAKAKEDADEAQRNADWYAKHSGGESSSEDKGFDPEEGDLVKLTLDEDDEVVEGKCIETTSKFIVVEDGDGDERKIKWADVANTERGAKLKPAAKKGKGKPVVEEDEDDEEEEAPAKKPAAKKKPVVEEDEDDEEEAPPTKSKKKPEPEPEPEPEADEDYEPEEGDLVVIKDADDEILVMGTVTSVDAKSITVEDEDEDEHTHRRAKVTVEAAPKPKAKAKPAAKKPVVEEDEDDEEEAPAKGKKAPAKKKPVVEEEEDEDDEEEAPKPKVKAKVKAKPVEEDEEDEDDAPPPRKAKAARSFDFDED